MEEIWRDIPNYKGYQASNLGRIRTYNKITYNAKHGTRHWKDRILKQKISKSTSRKNRYDARVNLWKDGKPKTFLVPRLIASAFLGESNLSVNHIDGNSLNNNINNLEWLPIKENIQKGFENGLYPTKRIKLTNKKTKESMEFYSLSKCSEYMGRNSAYISNSINKNRYENDDYIWSLL
jgi:hypothetical protein